MRVGSTSGIFHMSNRSPRAILELVIVREVQRVQPNIGEKEFEMRHRGAAALVAVTAGCLAAMGYVLFAHAQGMPSARRLAAMKADYRRPPARPAENERLVELGRNIFWDPRTSASGKTACASCHFPYLGWGTTDLKSRNDSGK